MVGLSTLVILGDRLEIWTLCTIHKYVFLAFLEELAIVFPYTITLISPSGALGLTLTYQLGSESVGGFSLPLTNRYRHHILYPLRLGLPFPNDVRTLRPKASLEPNQMLN